MIHHLSKVSNMCDPEGRNCIEDWASERFNCSIACDGIFVDIEREENDILTGEEGSTNNNEGMNGKGKHKGDLLNRKMFARLVEEYVAFKRNRVQHFRYDAEADSTNFGLYLGFLSLLKCDHAFIRS